MGSRLEHLRKEIQDRKSPLRHHSTNQKKSKRAYHGENLIHPSRKVIRGEIRRKRREVLEQVSQIPFNKVIFDLNVEKARNGEATQFSADYVNFHVEKASLEE